MRYSLIRVSETSNGMTKMKDEGREHFIWIKFSFHIFSGESTISQFSIKDNFVIDFEIKTIK